MLLIRFSHVGLLRTAAVLSVLISLIYLPSILHISLPIVGLGHESSSGQQSMKAWANYALIGGICIYAGTYVLNAIRSQTLHWVLLGIAFLATILLAAGQLPPLFWWMYTGMAVFSWYSVLGFVLHLSLMLVSLWGALVSLYAIELRGNHAQQT